MHEFDIPIIKYTDVCMNGIAYVQVIPGNSIIKWAMGSNVLLSHWIISNILRYSTCSAYYHGKISNIYIKAWEIFFHTSLQEVQEHHTQKMTKRMWFWVTFLYTKNLPPGCRNNILRLLFLLLMYLRMIHVCIENKNTKPGIWNIWHKI